MSKGSLTADAISPNREQVAGTYLARSSFRRGVLRNFLSGGSEDTLTSVPPTENLLSYTGPAQCSHPLKVLIDNVKTSGTREQKSWLPSPAPRSGPWLQVCGSRALELGSSADSSNLAHC